MSASPHSRITPAAPGTGLHPSIDIARRRPERMRVGRTKKKNM